MNYLIPLTYKLIIYDILNDNDISYENYDNENIYNINNFLLYINKENLIYKISSIIPLECLLDFLHNYNNLTIKKIYYFLIIKYLLKQEYNIKKDSYWRIIINYNEYNDILVRTRDYHICHNNKIIITDYINFNICFILINHTKNKSLLAIIDKNCLLECLYDVISNNGLYENNRFENIEIILIGGNIDNVDIIINIYLILKNLKLNKYIYKTFLFKNYKIKRLRFNTIKSKIKQIRFEPQILPLNDDNSNHINDPTFYSNLHRIN